MIKKVTSQFKLTKTIQFIEELNGGGERRLWWQDIRERLDHMTEGCLLIGGDILDEMVWVRGRQFYGNSYYSNCKDLTLRDPKEIKNYGRCNKPGQPILYASNNLETIYSELGLQVGDRVEVITIHKKEGVKFSYLSVGEVDNVRRYGRSLLGGDGITKEVKDHWNSVSDIERLRLNLTDAFVADRFRQFAKYPHEYKITSAYSDIIFSRKVDGFAYPSVGHLGGWNIAITEDAFLNNFEVQSAELFEIHDVSGYGIFGTISFGKSENIDQDSGEITWQKSVGGRFLKNFENFLNYALSLPGHRQMLLVFFKRNEKKQSGIPSELQDVEDKASKLGDGALLTIRSSAECR